MSMKHVDVKLSPLPLYLQCHGMGYYYETTLMSSIALFPYLLSVSVWADIT